MSESKGIITGFTGLVLILLFIPGCNTVPETKPELRGIWLHPGLFSTDQAKAAAQIDSLFGLYQGVGINNLFCYNAFPGENGFEWDYLNTLLEKGHGKGIRIHPIFYPGYNINLEKEMSEHRSWLIRDIDGKYEPHFNLANPEVKNFWLDKIKSALKYDIDGIHLDYMRFPITQMYSYDSLTCEAFKKIYGYTPVEVSHDCGSMIWCEWIKWNAKQVTELLAGMRQVIKESGRNIVLGVDVFPDAETSDVLIAQEWAKWAGTGLIDFICPMLYTNNTGLFREYLRNALEIAGNSCRVYPGIGVHTSHNDITKALLVQEVTIAREENTNGMVFFSGYSFNKEMQDTLKASVFGRNEN